jgi:hypothetical protein
VTRWTCLLAGLALFIGACGSNSKQAKTPPAPKATPTATAPGAAKPKPAAAADIAVIRGWTEALRHGDVNGASDYFTVPAIVSNGTPPIKLKKRKDVRFFNRTLPCGAKLEKAVDTGHYVVATLVLTERPGTGKCGTGVGNQAYTAFLIRRHKIAEWRRVIEPPGAEATPSGPQS